MACLQRWLLNWDGNKERDEPWEHLRKEHMNRGLKQQRQKTCSRNKLDLLEKMKKSHYLSFSSSRSRLWDKSLSASSLLGNEGNTSRSVDKWHREIKAVSKGYINKPATQWVTVLIPQETPGNGTKHTSQNYPTQGVRVEVIGQWLFSMTRVTFQIFSKINQAQRCR